MSIQGPQPMDVDSPAEQKTPDFTTPEHLKLNAPKEWESAGISQYLPFSKARSDNDTFPEAVKEWNTYSDAFITAVTNDRYTTDQQKKELLEILQQQTDKSQFVRAPELARHLNEKIQKSEGFNESSKKRLQTILKQLEPLLRSNIEGTVPENSTKKTFANKAAHPSEQFANRLKYADEELSKSHRNPSKLKTDCRIDDKTGKGVVSEFRSQSKPIVSAFRNTLMKNINKEKERAEAQHNAAQAKQIAEAEKIRNNKPRTYATAARK